MASFAPPPPSQGRPPSGMIGRRPPTTYDPRAGARPPTNFRPSGAGPQQPVQGTPGAINPYRNPRGLTPELLAQMARRRLGG